MFSKIGDEITQGKSAKDNSCILKQKLTAISAVSSTATTYIQPIYSSCLQAHTKTKFRYVFHRVKMPKTKLVYFRQDVVKAL